MNNTQNLVNYKLKNKISEFCVKISENIWKVEAKFTLDMIFWILSSWKVVLTDISRNLKEKISLDRTLKRLSTNLKQFKEEYIHEIRDNLLVWIKNQINWETVITLDWWDINKEWAMKMQGLYKVFDWSKKQIVSWYHLNSIVATNIIKDNKTWNNKIQNIPLNLSLYSTRLAKYESENRESIKCIDEVLKIIWSTWIWVFDRGYDRRTHIMKELLERNLKFIIRGVWNRNVIRKQNWKKILMKTLWDLIKVRSRIISFEYKEREKIKQLSWKVWYEKIEIEWIKEELTLCVLKKWNWELSMMMITNLEIKDNTDVLKVFSKYSCRWWVEDTYKYIKQEYWLEEIQLRNYSSLQNMMIFVFASMHFVSHLRKTEERYFCKTLVDFANILERQKLKNREHWIIAWIRFVLALSIIWIRDFLRNKIIKINWWLNLTLFDDVENPYKILGRV